MTAFPRTDPLSRPRTGMLEVRPRTKDTAAVLSKKKKGFKEVFQAISNSYAYPEFLIGEA